MLQRIRAWRAARQEDAALARARYHHLDALAGRLRTRLAGIDQPIDQPIVREWVLGWLAELEAAMAHNLRAGWPRRHRRAGPRRDLADSAALSHDLLRLVADTEAAIADPARSRLLTHTALEPVAGPVLDRAVEAGRLDQAVLDDLYVAVLPLVGGTAAEVLACLPVPAAAGGAR